jgi:4,5-DOPA dioxygenase extradiol
MFSLFVSHGSPMHATLDSRAARGWAALGARAMQAVGRPKAVLVASSHWETELPMVSTAAQPETIHDFGGFPEALYRIQYKAPGAPEVAQRAVALLRQAGLPASANGCRGLDHGAWVPLRAMFAQADLPVAQISIQPALDATHHLRVGRALAPLAADGVLVVGSGHMTHNLGELMQLLRRGQTQFGEETAAADYVEAFRGWVDASLRQLPGSAPITTWAEQAPHALRAHPTPEHFLPLLVAYSAAGEAPQVERIDLGVESQVLAMDAYLFTSQAAARARTSETSGSGARRSRLRQLV